MLQLRHAVVLGYHSQPDKPTKKSNSHPNDPRMTQSCYQPRASQDVSTELENMLALNGQTKTPINGHLPDSLLTASSTSIESNSDLEQPQQSKTTAGNGHSETKPSVTTVLRHLARRLAVRIAFKRERLAYVQQRVAKNTTEEKWVSCQFITAITRHACYWYRKMHVNARQLIGIGTKKAQTVLIKRLWQTTYPIESGGRS
ncbi:hypothetical protein AHF37_10748 [Paragonimus kellicotti]|nr:hypothetical protein AHF37_10748 [Paragonimus kellicotti]